MDEGVLNFKRFSRLAVRSMLAGSSAEVVFMTLSLLWKDWSFERALILGDANSERRGSVMKD